MMKTRTSLAVLALAALAACAQVPAGTVPVQQLDAAAVWSTGNYR